MGDITKLEVWQLSLELATTVYKLSQKGDLSKDYSFRDQIRRAAVSVPSNIAEGAGSGFDKLGVRYFYTARGSCVELQTQLLIAQKIDYIDQKEYTCILSIIESIMKMLNNLINYRNKLNREKR